MPASVPASVPAFGPQLQDPPAPAVHRTVLSRELRDELTDLRGELDSLLKPGRPGQDTLEGRLEALEARLVHACAVAHGGPDAAPVQTGLAPLRACLESIAEALFRHTGIPCRVLADPIPAGEAAPSLGQEQLEILEGIVREAVANVERHAHADSAEIQISTGVDGLRITVFDDGWGLCPAAALFPRAGGLARMRADATAVGGHLEIETPEAGGTRVSLCLPPTAVAL